MKIGELAQALGLACEGDPGLEIRGLAGLADATASDLSFVTGAKFAKAYASSRAGACIVPHGFEVTERACLRSAAPYADFARAIEIFHPRRRPRPGVHPTAAIGEGAVLGAGVAIGAFVAIGDGARIGDRSVLYPHVTVYPGVEVGPDCMIHSGAHLREGVRLGARVVVQSGAVVGSEGFGFTFGADGKRVRIPHTGGVVVGDDAEIGANTTIDASHPAHPRRGHESAHTRIGVGVKIDNLVHVGHGVSIGDHAILCGAVVLAGGVEIEPLVYMGGQSTVGGNVRVGAGTLVAGMSGITGDVPARSEVAGIPAVDRKLWGRTSAALKRLPELLRRVRRLEKRLGIEEGEG